MKNSEEIQNNLMNQPILYEDEENIQNLEEKIAKQAQEIEELNQRTLDLQEILDIISKSSNHINDFVPHIVVCFGILFLAIYAFYKLDL